MCFASAPATPSTKPEDYELVDAGGTVVPAGTKGAVRRLRNAYPESIMFSGQEASATGGVAAGVGAGAGADAGNW